MREERAIDEKRKKQWARKRERAAREAVFVCLLSPLMVVVVLLHCLT
jgi:hypothetical protein